MEYAISIKNIEKIYSPKKKNIRALNNISKDFEYGKFYLIVGHSGSNYYFLIPIILIILLITSFIYFIIIGKIKKEFKYTWKIKKKMLIFWYENKEG